MNFFSEDNFYRKYKTIRNKTRLYDFYTITNYCLNHLHKNKAGTFEYLENQPWLALLLMKSITIDQENFSNQKKTIWPKRVQLHIRTYV